MSVASVPLRFRFGTRPCGLVFNGFWRYAASVVGASVMTGDNGYLGDSPLGQGVDPGGHVLLLSHDQVLGLTRSVRHVGTGPEDLGIDVGGGVEQLGTQRLERRSDGGRVDGTDHLVVDGIALGVHDGTSVLGDAPQPRGAVR